jgi:prevent-host-death family protein
MTVRIPSRELRNDTAGVLRKVDAGEDVIITVNGQDRARLSAVDPRTRPRSMPSDVFFRRFRPADRGLLDELREMLPESTDDLPWR